MFVADYVLMGYGTGAIMAVPGHDERDWEFAEEFGLPIVRTVQPPDRAGEGDGIRLGDGRRRSTAPTTRPRPERTRRSPRPSAASSTGWRPTGAGRGAVTYKLRDWLFSRQRYWGEPFPIVYDDDGLPRALPDSMLPVVLPRRRRLSPRDVRATTRCRSRSRRSTAATDWVEVDARPRRRPARPYRRETNTMPQWAGSCWYELRYLDPTNERRFVDPAIERVLDGSARDGDCGGVDLYVGGVEHAVLHLLYARFWHKVLYDLGHVSSPEPYHRLFNQGYIQADAYIDERGMYVEAAAGRGARRRRSSSTASRSRASAARWARACKNAVTPDEMYDSYGADTLRLYEMFMGPLDQSRPWEHQRRRRHVPVPATDVAQRGRRGHRRHRTSATRPPTTTTLARAAPHHRRRPRRHGDACGSTRRSPG